MGSKVKSIPFATYDLAVYLPGGFLILSFLNLVFLKNFGVDFPFRELSNSFANEGNSVSLSFLLDVILVISISYLIGHLASFISSYVIEKFVHFWLGFPANVYLDILDLRVDESPREVFRSQLERARKNFFARETLLVHMVISVAQAPAILILIICYIFKPFGFYTPKIPKGVKEKAAENLKTAGFPDAIVRDSRWDKLLEHYTANHCPLAYQRLYNYLVIYGALRMIALIGLMICWYLPLSTAFNINISEGLFSLQWAGFSCWNFVICFLIVPSIYVLSLMAFSKFNRRFFEESLFAVAMNGHSQTS
tara:strand:- start:2897 stop:3820 length:924 start_codon:yes stop_codon:yes gene_type:complete